MKQAFLMMAHKNEEQTKRLIEWIADENHEVYVHIDKKSQSLFKDLSQYFNENPHVFFVEQRVGVNWGGLSQVLVMIELLKQTVGKKYDFYHLISGQDLFIKFNEYLSMFYKKFPIRPNLKGVTVYKGANWFTLSGDCVTFVLDYLQQHPKFIRQFKHTICADEHFFQTLIMNSPFKETVINNTLREIQWGGVENPKTYTMSDADLLLDSPELFARKFDSDVDREIIDWVYCKIK